MSEKNEDQLIADAIQGDENAFAALVTPYRSRIFHLCLGIVRDYELAEEIVEDAYLHAYQHLKDFRHEAKFYTWLYKIAKNLSLNALKKKKRREKEKISDEPERPTSKRIKQFAYGKEIEEKEITEILQKVCEMLPTHQKQVFKMFIFEGKKSREIAEELNIPHGTVRSRLFYAKKKIKSLGLEL